MGRGFTSGTLEVVGIYVGFNLSKWRFNQRWDLTSHNEYGIEAANMFFHHRYVGISPTINGI
jgi:hypothetical protein